MNASLRGGGRSRGARKSAAYAAMSLYSKHFTQLLVEELRYEKDQVYARLLTWEPARLASQGFALFGVAGVKRGKLFGDHVVRFSLPPLPKPSDRAREGHGERLSGSASRRLPFHRFTPGDVITVTEGRQAPRPTDLSGGTGEGVVLSCSLYHVDVVMRLAPSGLASVSSGGKLLMRMDASTVQFRLDQCVSGVSYERQFVALRATTAPDANFMCQVIRSLLVDSMPSTLPGGKEGGHASPSSSWSVKLNLTPATPNTLSVRWQPLIPHPHPPTMAQGAVDAEVRALTRQGALNKRQGEALKEALTQKLTLIQGPPGTGKTRTACHLLQLAVKLRESSSGDEGKVLAVAFSNVAADNLLEGALALGLHAVRLGRPASVRPSLWDATLASRIDKHPRMQAAAKYKGRGKGEFSRDRGSRMSSARGDGTVRGTQELEAQLTREIILEADVVVCSCIGAGTETFLSALDQCPDTGVAAISFTTVLVDEATQATEPSVLVPLTRGCQQLILVGDQNQLPPTIMSPQSQAGGLGSSMFCRLLDCGIKPILLNMQYRAHPMLADFPNMQFYGGSIRSVPKPMDRLPPKGFPWPQEGKIIPAAFLAVKELGIPSLLFSASLGSTRLHCAPSHCRYTSPNSTWPASSPHLGTSWCNRGEAAAVVDSIVMLLEGGDIEPQDIGIITPYAAQVLTATPRFESVKSCSPVRLVGDLLRVRLPKTWQMIEVRSVDGYQGREKEVIVLSAVRSNKLGQVGFLSDFRRLNVAITRARRGSIVVGNPLTLSSDHNWKAFIQW
ncbi:unnamed protein product [Chrysoparadoxa australica]